MEIFRFLLLIMSFAGYLYWLSAQIRSELAIGFLFACISSAFVLAGILNIMVEMTVLVAAGSILCLVDGIRKRFPLKTVCSLGMAFFLVMCLVFAIILQGNKLIRYDNFSHWAIVAKTMILQNRTPTAQDSYIYFQSYPVGSVSLLFYAAKITGDKSEVMQMWMQAITEAGMASSVFTFAKTVKGRLLAVFTALCLLCGNIGFRDLLVDTLLPITAVSAFAFCSYYRDEIERHPMLLLPWMLFLVSIKSSGCAFAGMILLYALLTIHPKGDARRAWMILALCPILLMFFWGSHVRLVFPNGLLSKHSVSLANYLQGIREKTANDIVSIKRALLLKLFSVDNQFLFILFLLLALVVFRRTVLRMKRAETWRITVYPLLCYVFFQFGLLAMYFFSMPLYEARILAGFSRYQKIILIFTGGITAISAIQMVEQAKVGKERILSLLLCGLSALALFWGVRPDFTYLGRQELAGTLRQQFDDLIGDYELPKEAKYIILEPDGDSESDFLFFMSRYLLEPEEVAVYTVSDLDGHNELLDDYDYLIVIKQKDDTKLYLQEHFGSSEPVARLHT
ncbi:MAG: hypothetical protein IJ179_09800 [Oscillospiraceae bacterium]|nr:hypothetical protein [Oscillospiraceae bacterium]